MPEVAHSSPISQRARWAGGQPISYLMQQALAHPHLISLAAGFVDQETLPAEATRQAFEALWANSWHARAALQYGTTAGYPPLRDMLLADLLAADRVVPGRRGPSIDQLIVTAGSNQMLHLLADTLFDPGDIVLTAAPSYFVYLGMLRNLGVRSIGVASDAEGLVPEALDDALGRLASSGELPRVKAVYLVSYFDNPRGASMPPERKTAIVELARRWSRGTKIHVIDDVAYRELRYEGDDVPSLLAFDPDGDTVIVAQTFSKSFSPGLRVGYGLLPPRLVEPVCNQKGNADFGSPNLNQHLLAAVLEQGLFCPHVERLRSNYRGKLGVMLDAADKLLSPLEGVRWQRPAGGLYVWLELPAAIDTGPAGRLFELALAEGVLYVPGEYCYPAEGQPIRADTIRLSFGVQPPEKIRQGMEALARAIRNAME